MNTRALQVLTSVALTLASTTFSPLAYAADEKAAASASDFAELKAQLAQQQQQIEQLRKALEEQKKLLEASVKAAAPDSTQTSPAPAERAKPANVGQVASTSPMIPLGIAPKPVAIPPVMPVATAAPQAAAQTAIPESPLQLRIGAATITPVGFLDATNTWRSTNSGASLATNFGNYPYNNTLPQGKLTEDKLTLQNSRIGFRVDALYKDYHVLGYYEGDFVGGIGNAAFNTQVSSNSVIYRLRLYWVDVRKDKWEVLGGQSWSMMTPSRNHIGALPGDLFYGQEFDVNYLNGLTWGRIPGFRFLYHPSNTVTWGIAAENATQYFGGSGGGGTPVLPAALGASGANIANSELDANVNNGIVLPNVHPDIISKLAFDPSSRVHVEVGGVLDTVKIYNPTNPPTLGARQTFTKTGGGGQINANFEVVKNFRLFTNNFWSDGAGRYIFGEAPNFIVRADGSPSLLHSGSTVDGFEWTVGKSLIYGYYGGIYVGRNTARDVNGSFIGYGYPGSANSQNRTMQEGTVGLTQTLFRDPKYGQVSFYLDYAYFWRNPWAVLPGTPKAAHQNAVWFDLRYTLPGSAPTIKY